MLQTVGPCWNEVPARPEPSPANTAYAPLPEHRCTSLVGELDCFISALTVPTNQDGCIWPKQLSQSWMSSMRQDCLIPCCRALHLHGAGIVCVTGVPILRRPLLLIDHGQCMHMVGGPRPWILSPMPAHPHVLHYSCEGLANSNTCLSSLYACWRTCQ